MRNRDGPPRPKLLLARTASLPDLHLRKYTMTYLPHGNHCSSLTKSVERSGKLVRTARVYTDSYGAAKLELLLRNDNDINASLIILNIRDIDYRLIITETNNTITSALFHLWRTTSHTTVPNLNSLNLLLIQPYAVIETSPYMNDGLINAGNSCYLATLLQGLQGVLTTHYDTSKFQHSGSLSNKICLLLCYLNPYTDTANRHRLHIRTNELFQQVFDHPEFCAQFGRNQHSIEDCVEFLHSKMCKELPWLAESLTITETTECYCASCSYTNKTSTNCSLAAIPNPNNTNDILLPDALLEMGSTSDPKNRYCTQCHAKGQMHDVWTRRLAPITV